MSAQPAADLVLYNGNVITLGQPAVARAVAVRGGRIVCVGRAEDVLNGAGAKAHRIDLGGRTLVPGLNDAHAHIWKIGQLLTTMLDLRRVGSMEELVSSVAALDHQLSLGITSSADCGVRPQLVDVYRAMDAKGALPSRVNVMPLRRVDGVASAVPLPERFVSDRLRIDTVKFLADGGLSGATAALSIPYRHTHSSGVLRF